MDRIYVNHASASAKKSRKDGELPMLITFLVNVIGGVAANTVKLWMDATDDEANTIISNFEADKANGLRWVIEGNVFDVMVDGVMGVRQETNPKTGEVRSVRYVRIEEGYTLSKEEKKRSGNAAGLLS
jgi:hypothetical protein